ncbi:MAG TPA: LysR family transcriptional regulator [Acetobacteraceae bacterium]|nr:LysR family transcriptional regulator [Acetobacteraceae bacterium]
MDLDLLKSFAVLAETCHFGDASRRLGISQPSLSKQIRRLEDILGVSLFRRGRQGTELTAFGQHFLTDVQPILRLADHVWEKSLRAARGERGRLAIGFTYSSVEIMAEILPRFQKDHPEVELAFDDVASRIQGQRLREGSLDVGFMRLPIEEDLAFLPVGADRLAFVFPAGMTGEIEDFDSAIVRSLPFIGLQTSLAPGLEIYIQRLFASRGFQPRIIHRVNGSLTQLVLVASGLGVALMHESSLRPVANPGVAVRPLLDPIARWEEGLVWRQDEDNPLVLRFVRAARDILAIRRGGAPQENRNSRPPPRRGNEL